MTIPTTDLIAALSSSDARAVQAALRTLGQQGSASNPAAPAVIALIERADTATRRDTVWALG
jgi:hypothetical protein